jgi:hypothetical protein
LKSAFQGAPRQASAFADAKGTFPVGAGLHADWKSAFQGAPRQASASADAKDTLPVGAGFHAD